MYSGVDSSGFLQGLTTNNVEEIDQIQYTSFLTPKSRIFAEGMLFKLSEDNFIFDTSIDKLPVCVLF